MTTPLRVGLFAPCFVDRLVPQTAWAAWHVLRAFGVEVVVEPDAPPCCGQPLSSMGQPDRSCDTDGRHASDQAHHRKRERERAAVLIATMSLNLLDEMALKFGVPASTARRGGDALVGCYEGGRRLG